MAGIFHPNDFLRSSVTASMQLLIVVRGAATSGFPAALNQPLSFAEQLPDSYFCVILSM
jgi:hypothetical protein